jgi:hypothetical protein
MPRISYRHALTPQEFDFCKIYVAFGESNHTEAYRRAFLTRIKGGAFVEPEHIGMTSEELNVLPPVSPKEATRRAKQLLKQDHIIQYIAEIGKPASDHARGVLSEQAMFGDAQASRKAAEEILKQEDKMGFRDAVERWAEILCEIGAEIEVPLPTSCPNCGHGLSATAPLGEMFKQREEG